MITEFLMQDVVNGKVYDISDLTSSLEWVTDIDYQPGKLTFTMLLDDDAHPKEGNILRLKVDNKPVFFGKIFVKQKSKDAKWQITAYDQMRYLKNEDTIVFKASTSDARFKQICELQGLPYKILDKSGWAAPVSVQDKKSYFSMIQNTLDLTLINYGMWYIIRDNFGTLEHVALNRLVTNLVIGDESLATDYDYKASIDDAFNQIKLTRENQDTQKREVYLVKDSKNIGFWGKLQYHDTVDENLSEAQIKSQAELLLKAKNKVNKTLKIPAIGHLGISSGSGIILMFSDLEKEGFAKQQLAIVSKCTHLFDKVHTMDLEVRVV